jgi:acyl-CoA thioesterase-2
MDERWLRPFPEILRIEPAGARRFRARLGGFGGETLGCATLAAGRSCPERALHSLHTYFLRPVPSAEPVEIGVESLRDGRRFAHRRVQVRADENLLCELVASFAAPADGAAYQEAQPEPGLPAPDALPDEQSVARAEGWRPGEPGPLFGPFEWRFVGDTPWRPAASSRYRAWVRPRFPLPDEPALRAAVLAFLSDYHSHLPAARRLGGHFEPMGYTSLDQVMWVHRDLAWNDWWLLTSESDVACAGRALVRRSLHTREGLLVATMAQEALLPS